MTWSIVVALIVIGLILLVLEILVIPGTGIVGVLGLGSLAFAVYSTYTHFGNIAGHITVGSILVVSSISIYYSIRSKTWKKLSLKSEIKSKVNVIDNELIGVGDIGITISRLVPAGKARINDELFEVHTMGFFVDENTKIKVLKIEGNKVLVKPVEKNQED